MTAWENLIGRESDIRFTKSIENEKYFKIS
jgi:hypothetical protein